MNYNEVIEYIDGTYDPNFNEAKSWATAHDTTFEEDLDRRDLPKRYFVIGPEPEPIPEPEPHEPTREEVASIRAELYNKNVDPLMSEYNRKKTFNLFEEGEEAELLAEIENRVAEIKENNPYPVEQVSGQVSEQVTPVEEVVVSKMENTIEEID